MNNCRYSSADFEHVDNSVHGYQWIFCKGVYRCDFDDTDIILLYLSVRLIPTKPFFHSYEFKQFTFHELHLLPFVYPLLNH
jgi:hypothetical protein